MWQSCGSQALACAYVVVVVVSGRWGGGHRRYLSRTQTNRCMIPEGTMPPSPQPECHGSSGDAGKALLFTFTRPAGKYECNAVGRPTVIGMSASCPGHQMVGLRRHGGLTAHGARRCAPVPQVHRYTRRLSFCRCTAAGAARRHAGQPAVAGGSHGALPPPQLADRQAKPPWQAPQRRCARCRCGKSLEMHGAGSTHNPAHAGPTALQLPLAPRTSPNRSCHGYTRPGGSGGAGAAGQESTGSRCVRQQTFWRLK